MSSNDAVFYLLLIFLVLWNGGVWFFILKASIVFGYQPVLGIVKSSKIEFKSSDSGDRHLLTVVYSYKFKDKSFESSQVNYTGKEEFEDKEVAESELSKYPKGSKVSVFVNPLFPNSAVLKKQIPYRAIPLVLGGGFGAYLIMSIKT